MSTIQSKAVKVTGQLENMSIAHDINIDLRKKGILDSKNTLLIHNMNNYNIRLVRYKLSEVLYTIGQKIQVIF